MLDVPSRRDLAALIASANAIVPTLAAGFARPLDDGRIWVLMCHPHGMSEHQLPAVDLPPVLRPDAGAATYADAETLAATGERALEWQLAATEVQAALSLPVNGMASALRFWVGLGTTDRPTVDQIRALAAVAHTAAEALPGVRER